jgi:hypothetical protein
MRAEKKLKNVCLVFINFSVLHEDFKKTKKSIKGKVRTCVQLDIIPAKVKAFS